MADNKKDEVLEVSSAKKAYLLGQKRSTFTEALTVGYTPLILIASNIAIALGTAGFVAWLLHKMPWAFPKMALFAVVGAVAAIYISSRLSFASQIIGHLNRLPMYAKKAGLSPDYVKWTKQKMRYSIFQNLLLFIVGLSLVVVVHITLILIMYASFTDSLLMKDLGIVGGEFAYIVLGLGMEIASGLVDIFLGLNTRIRVNVEEFFPDLDEMNAILQRKTEYEKLEKKIDDLSKSGGKPQPAPNNSTKTGSNQPGNSGDSGAPSNSTGGLIFPKPKEVLKDISGYGKNEDIFKIIFKDTNFDGAKFDKILSELSDTARRKKVSKAIAGEIHKIKSLYSQGSIKDSWEANGEAIWKDVVISIKRIANITKSIGYTIEMK